MVAVKEQWILDTQLPMLYENKHTIRNQSRQEHSLSNKEEIGQESVNESRTLKVFDFFLFLKPTSTEKIKTNKAFSVRPSMAVR